MQSRRLKVLVCSEASWLSTGYSVMTAELMNRWLGSAKYELYEYSSYGQLNDPRAAGLRWPFMSVMPDPNSKQEVDLYNSNPSNAFGAWKFEHACLWAKPDIVVDFRDVWMFEHEAASSLRPHYHLAVMPPVDAYPQDQHWIDTLMRADSVLTYTDWSGLVLLGQAGTSVPLKGTASPGVDTEVFKPKTDKRAHKAACGIDPESLVVGFVARNQKRKLFPDLIQAFAEFLKQAPPELASKTYLYLHTAWPDVGWDIPRLLKEAGIGNRCFFTYLCRSCGSVFTAFFSDTKAGCRRCGQLSAGFSNTHAGVTREVLSEIYNIFDVYVQYANSEGLGIPLLEAAACGIPIMAVNYSAMSDVVEKLGGTPINVQRLFREQETHCWRALPDNQDFIEKLEQLLRLPDGVRQRKGRAQREAVKERFNWDKSALAWEAVFDAVDLTKQRSWDSPPYVHPPARQAPPNLTDSEFVTWGFTQVANRPDFVNSYLAMQMARDLGWGYSSSGGRFDPFNRERAMQVFINLCEQKNSWETARRTSL